MQPQHIEEDLSAWRHEHVFGGASDRAERRARIVMWITLATMALEIAAGWWYNSMALLADGWHMSSHALAIGLAAFAYAAARRYARDPRFAATPSSPAGRASGSTPARRCSGPGARRWARCGPRCART